MLMKAVDGLLKLEEIVEQSSKLGCYFSSFDGEVVACCFVDSDADESLVIFFAFCFSKSNQQLQVELAESNLIKFRNS